MKSNLTRAVKRDRDLYKHTPVVEPPEEDIGPPGAIIPNRKITSTAPAPTNSSTAISRPRPPKRTNERAALEQRLKDHVLGCWHTLETHKQGMEQGSVADVSQWMSTAKELISGFKSVRSFFPQEKNKRITWFDEDVGTGTGGGGRKRKAADIEARMEEIQNRLLDPVVIERTGTRPRNARGSGALTVASPEVESAVFERQDLSKEMFRGLEFERWFYIFIQASHP